MIQTRIFANESRELERIRKAAGIRFDSFYSLAHAAFRFVVARQAMGYPA
jgi:hypothetical protein